MPDVNISHLRFGYVRSTPYKYWASAVFQNAYVGTKAFKIALPKYPARQKIGLALTLHQLLIGCINRP